MTEEKKKTVAVVGSGLAGLVTAYLLHNDPQQRYQVRLLEQVRIYGRQSRNHLCEVTNNGL